MVRTEEQNDAVGVYFSWLEMLLKAVA